MQKDWETFLEAYQNASSDVRELFDSEKIGVFAERLIQEYGIESRNQREMVALISELFLSLQNTDDVINYFIDTYEIPSSEVKTFSGEIKEFLGNPGRVSPEKRASEEQGKNNGAEKIRLEADQTSPQPENAQEQTEQPVETPPPKQTPTQVGESTDADPSNIAPLRTMESDAERIHGYGAYRNKQNAEQQNEKRNRLADTPQYHDDEEE